MDPSWQFWGFCDSFINSTMELTMEYGIPWDFSFLVKFLIFIIVNNPTKINSYVLYECEMESIF